MGVPFRLARTHSALRIAAVGALVLGAALAGMVWTVVRVQRVHTDAFAPLLDPGDRAIIGLDRSRSRPLRTDDVVLYRPTDSAAEVLGGVLHADADRVWIGAADAAVEVSRAAVAGKVVNGRRQAAAR